MLELLSATMQQSFNIVDQIGLILLIGIISARIAKLFRIPMLIPLLVTGLFLGPFGLGLIKPEYFGFSLSGLVIFVVPLFLFGEALSTDLNALRSVARPVILLVTLGVFVTALGVAAFSYFLLGLPVLVSLLLGSIVAATDPTVVVPLLQGVNKRIATLLKAESSLNDPVSIVMFSVIVQLMEGGTPPTALAVVLSLLKLLVGGALIGAAMGVVSTTLIQRFNVRERLSYVSLIVFVIAYSFAEYLGTSGIVAAVFCGIVFGHEIKSAIFSSAERQELFYFWENVSFLTQLVIFLLLGLNVTRGMLLGQSAIASVLVTASLILLIRPLAVFVSTAFDKMKNNERLFISWMGARGAVPAALASIVVGISASLGSFSSFSESVFEITLFTVVVSTLVVGFTTKPVARALKVVEREPFEELSALLAERKTLKSALDYINEKKKSSPLSIYQNLEQELISRIEEVEKKIASLQSSIYTEEFLQRQTLLERREVLIAQLQKLAEMRRNEEITEEVYQKLRTELNKNLKEIERLLESAKAESPSKR
ncbi:hypothetical protein B9Q11_02750 [Candidatus Marsarchaeota G2 archaeon ECH_B_SAG-F08]|jgi:NhaP-type Na+/H+ or K+/H+ antiporter|uniref:Cation/H+ exchanger transmembrane domain-containing protein n=2 Tax=Candidatus Marsarchaeota TaxID=1978152 RepID=A0A2R6AGG7_9ARCH|nr:MAG: hypothetical protein B9Q02_06230 [Candidatus Marsarchaeota G1 archaeon BE_D]PSN98186.1 MAG: hypothetical protein B9Q11_02750 [Candidatus Marsarchaeota G2 archaeon ECH_B_SAG-F08]